MYKLAGRCMAVDREFAHVLIRYIYSFVVCCSVVNVLRLILLSLGWLWPPFASLEMLVGPFGATWPPKGLSLRSRLGIPLAPLGCRWAPLGLLGLPRGAWSNFDSNMDVLFCQ